MRINVDALISEGRRIRNYYPFGSVMPDREWSNGNYSFGFNGQERDGEVYGAGNAYTAEYWEYDSRIGRRWNIDPAFMQKPWMSSYHAFSNKPITNIDPNGALDGDYYTDLCEWLGSDGEDDGNVYVVQNKSDVKYKTDGSGNVDKVNTTNTELLPITHDEFQKLSGLAAKEDGDRNAIFGIANAQGNRIENNYLDKGKTFKQGFDSFNSPNAKKGSDGKGTGGLHGFMLKNRELYKKYWNMSPSERNNNSRFVTGQSAVINAWSVHGYDNSNGAIGWQGRDVWTSGWPAYEEWQTKGYAWQSSPIISHAEATPISFPSHYTSEGNAAYTITASHGATIFWK